MTETSPATGLSAGASAFLAGCAVDDDVLELRPDYRALLVVVEGIDAGAPSSVADGLIAAAEARARELTADTPVTELPHVAAWREAYRAFGAKPKRTRNSLEALTRRAREGLPRVNALTDLYNAISVLHQIPLGGEDLARYEGSARLVRATGEEDFDTMSAGEGVIEHPDPGEVVWRDDAGVTCRRWNWRQCRRTALTDGTESVYLVLDLLDPVSDRDAHAAADALVEVFAALGDDVRSERRLIARD